VNHTASTNAADSNAALIYDPALQVPSAARLRENREGGASPPRAQRCKEDGPGSALEKQFSERSNCHWREPGRRLAQVNPSQKTGLKHHKLHGQAVHFVSI